MRFVIGDGPRPREGLLRSDSLPHDRLLGHPFNRPTAPYSDSRSEFQLREPDMCLPSSHHAQARPHTAPFPARLRQFLYPAASRF